MTIKIITRHAVANYGSILQAYATEKIFESLGCECEIINYVRSDEQGKNISRTMLKRNRKWNRNFVLRFIYLMLQTPIYNGSYNNFKKFRKHLLTESEREYSSEKELETLPGADIYCTGSDQVWGQIGNVQFDENYFLSFVPEGRKCISFASSFGKDVVSDELKSKLPELLSKYSAITVREKCAKDLLQSIGIEAELMLDPTLLLTKEDWAKLCTVEIKKSGYVLTYQLHEDKKLEEFAEKFAKKIGKPLIRISISWLYRFKSGNFVYMPSPEEFLSYFRNCEYVITDSFHATVFSIIFNKKFVDVLPQNSGNRITSLLDLLGLSDRILKQYNDFTTLQQDIDYTSVNKILNEEKIRTMESLKKIIFDE